MIIPQHSSSAMARGHRCGDNKSFHCGAKQERGQQDSFVVKLEGKWEILGSKEFCAEKEMYCFLILLHKSRSNSFCSIATCIHCGSKTKSSLKPSFKEFIRKLLVKFHVSLLLLQPNGDRPYVESEIQGTHFQSDTLNIHTFLLALVVLIAWHAGYIFPSSYFKSICCTNFNTIMYLKCQRFHQCMAVHSLLGSIYLISK